MNLLPIGSIVILKDGVKKVMIFGRKQLDLETNVLYDYISCLYPEGNIDAELNFLFNHEDIESVIFRGYEDEEELEFLKSLEAIESEVNTLN